jgi:hypothetical protein
MFNNKSLLNLLLSKASNANQEKDEKLQCQKLGQALIKAYLRDQKDLDSLKKQKLSSKKEESNVSLDLNEHANEHSLKEQYPALFKVIQSRYSIEKLQQTEKDSSDESDAEHPAEERVLDLMVAVFQKLGKEKLQKIYANEDIAMSTKVFEWIGHYLNKLCRGVSRGYAGYTFSDKEAREAIAGLHDPTKTFFGFDNNTRFAQVANEQGIIMQEGSVILYKEQNEEADLSNQDSDEEMRENLPHPEESGDFTPQQHSELNIEEELNIKEDVPFAAEAEDSNKLDLQLPENVEAQANFRVLIEQQKQDILAEQPFTL